MGQSRHYLPIIILAALVSACGPRSFANADLDPAVGPGELGEAGQADEGIPACGSYTVMPGDTLSGIAARVMTQDVGIDEILAVNRNDLTSSDLIYVGQVLRIPCSVNETEGPAENRTNVADLDPAPILETRREEVPVEETIVEEVIVEEVGIPVLAETHTPILVAAPIWEAHVGESLVDVLIRWGRLSGFEVILERGSDWRFGVPFRHTGSFRGAVDEVVAGFSTAATPPYITFYTNNVMTIGAR